MIIYEFVRIDDSKLKDPESVKMAFDFAANEKYTVAFSQKAFSELEESTKEMILRSAKDRKINLIELSAEYTNENTLN